jgi:hypothetical protein
MNPILKLLEVFSFLSAMAIGTTALVLLVAVLLFGKRKVFGKPKGQ